MKFLLILLLINYYSCKQDNSYLKTIKYYIKNSSYNKKLYTSCNILNIEADKIFLKNKVTPIFRIENILCDSIWITQNKKKELFLYNTMIKRNIIKKKKLKMIKSFKSEYLTSSKLTVFKNGKRQKNVKIKGYFYLFKKVINKQQSNKLMKILNLINSDLKSCNSKYQGDSKRSDSSLRYITFKRNDIKSLEFNDPNINKHKEKYLNDYYNDNNCIQLKNLIDFIYQLINKT